MVDEPMNSDSFVGSKLRITIDTEEEEEEVEETLLQLQLSSSLSVITIHQQETPIDSKKKANCFSFLSDRNQDWGFPSFTENASLSGHFDKQKTDINVENKVCSFEVQEVEDNAIEVDVSFFLEADKKIVVKGKGLDSVNVEEAEMKLFWGELEVGKISDDDNNIVAIKELSLPFRVSLKIEAIDDTVLIGTFPLSKTGNGGAKDDKESRRKGKNAKKVSGEAVKLMKSTKTVKLENGNRESKNQSMKHVYSRKELEALRYVKVVEQRELWRDVYNGLAADVIREYDDLASWNSDTRHHCLRNCPAVKSVVAGRGTRNNGLHFFVH